MSKLFIIGNGFDLAHGLKTAYSDFQDYLSITYPTASEGMTVPGYMLDGEGNEVPTSELEVVGFIARVLSDTDGDRWRDIEASIGGIEFDNYVMSYDHDDEDEDDDDLFHARNFNESWAMSLVQPLLAIPSYFAEWIDTISPCGIKMKKEFLQLIDRCHDLFLSFNYTRTLEDLYGVHPVCHIHGIQGQKLVFGHGEEFDYFSEDNYGRVPGTEDSYQTIHERLKKDTITAIKTNIAFFNGLDASITEIYSFGFSFSPVDEVYIAEICRRIDTTPVTWYLSAFENEEERAYYRRVIRRSGFQGVFDIYIVYSNRARVLRL